MKKLLALIALVALVIFCTLFTKINTAAAPLENKPIAGISVPVSSDLVHDAMPSGAASSTLAERIVSTIEAMETQGHPNCGNARGGSGEHGCLQFQLATWRAYSIELYGKVVPMTPSAEREVAEFKAQKWLDAGYSPRQIFLIWNQGNPSPCKAGVNRFGVRFDSCAYAKKGMDLLDSMR